MSWEATLNKQGMKIFNFTRMAIKNVNILQECKESKDANKLLRASMTSEFIDNENENSIRVLFYLEELQDTTEKRLKKLQFKITTHKTNKNLNN
jgi:ribosomal protein S3AE